MKPSGAGWYRDQNRVQVHIDSQGPDGKWYGQIPGHMTATWWHPDGRHNTFENHNILCHDEPFTVTCGDGRIWTRDTKSAAIALADNIAFRENRQARVTLTENGYLEYETVLDKDGC